MTIFRQTTAKKCVKKCQSWHYLILFENSLDNQLLSCIIIIIKRFKKGGQGDLNEKSDEKVNCSVVIVHFSLFGDIGLDIRTTGRQYKPQSNSPSTRTCHTCYAWRRTCFDRAVCLEET
jgi:hypothetical protein